MSRQSPARVQRGESACRAAKLDTKVQIGKFRLTFLTKPKNHGGAGGTPRLWLN